MSFVMEKLPLGAIRLKLVERFAKEILTLEKVYLKNIKI
jgi:hypothetical protein